MAKMQYFSDIKIVLETLNYCVFVPNRPHIDRDDGGHICIGIKHWNCFCLQDLSDKLLFELSILTKTTGAALLKLSDKKGYNIKLINYQLNGNWTYNLPNGANLHMHLYGRSTTAVKQPFGQCLVLPDKKRNPEYYASNKPFDEEDIGLLRDHIKNSLKDAYEDIITIVE